MSRGVKFSTVSDGPGTDPTLSFHSSKGVIVLVKILFSAQTFTRSTPSVKIVMFCFRPVLPERPDGESHGNLPRAQLHRRRADLTGRQVLQCVQRFVFLLSFGQYD